VCTTACHRRRLFARRGETAGEGRRRGERPRVANDHSPSPSPAVSPGPGTARGCRSGERRTILARRFSFPLFPLTGSVPPNRRPSPSSRPSRIVSEEILEPPGRCPTSKSAARRDKAAFLREARSECRAFCRILRNGAFSEAETRDGHPRLPLNDYVA
jgi:hypothetical protein